MRGESKGREGEIFGVEIIRQLKPIVDEINQIVKDLDPAIKESMAQSLWDVSIGNTPTGSEKPIVNKQQVESDSEVGSETGKSGVSTLGGYVQYKNPQTSGHRAVAIAGFYLEQKETDIVTAEHIKQGFAELGEPLPDRIDNTIRNTSFEGKKLFQKVGEGWKLNFAGQELLKKRMPMTQDASPPKVVRKRRKKKNAKAENS